MALGRHGFVGILGLDTGDQRALRGVARDDGGAVGLAAFECAGPRVEMQLTLRLAALVTFEAAGFEDREDLRVEIHAAGLHGFHLALVSDNLLTDKMVDGVIGGEVGGERRDGRLGRLSEPLLGGFATFLPVVALAGTGGSAGGRIDLGETRLFLRGVGLPARVVIGRVVGGRRQELPVGAAGKGDRRDGLAEFRPATIDGRAFDVDDEANDGLEDDAVFAALGFEFDPSVAIARRRETEVASEIEETVLILNWFVVGAGGREGGLHLQLSIDEEGRGSASAQEQAMLARREFHARERPEEVRVAAFGAHAGIDVFFGHAGEAEGGGEVAIDGLGRLFGPDVGGRLPVLAEFDADLAVGDRGPVDLRGFADDDRGLGGLRAAGAIVAGVRAGADLGDLGFRDWRKCGGEAFGDLFGRH